MWQKIFPFRIRLSSLLRSSLAVLFTLQFVSCKDYESPACSNDDDETGNRVDVISFQETDVELIDPDDYAGNIIGSWRSFAEEMSISKYEALYNPLLKVLKEAITLSKTKVVSKLDRQFEAEAGLPKQTGHSWQIESRFFNYRSKSARGEDVVLSGRVTFPNHKTKGVGHKVKAMMIYMRGAPQVRKENSERLSSDVQIQRVFFDEAIIEPDGQGLGANLDKDYYCSASPNALARQMADCTLAALEVMQRHGVTLAADGHTICVGHSLGGAVPLAFAKCYETEVTPSFREKVKLSAVYSGNGPLDFGATFRHFSEHPECNAMLSKTLLFSLAALSREQMYGYRAQDFVNPKLLNTQVEYNGRTISYFDAEARYFINVLGTNKEVPNPTKLSEIVAPDLLGRDGKLDGTNPKTQTLMRILDEQGTLSGWLPTIPIYIMHGAEDDGVPVVQARKCYNELSNLGGNPNVHYKEIDIPFAVLSLGKLVGICTGHMYGSLFFQNMMFNYEDVSVLWEK